MQYLGALAIFIFILSQIIESILPNTWVEKYPDLALNLSMYIVFGGISLFVIVGVIGLLLPFFRRFRGRSVQNDEKIIFGKYRGMYWRDIPQDYLEWIISTFDRNKEYYRAENELASRRLKKIKKKKTNNETFDDRVIGIIESKRRCWKCGYKTRVIAIKTFARMDLNSEYLGDGIHCYIKTIDNDILKVIQSKYPFYKYKYSHTVGYVYAANCCEKCDSLQGDFNLYQEPDEPFFDIEYLDCKYYLKLKNGKLKFVKK